MSGAQGELPARVVPGDRRRRVRDGALPQRLQVVARGVLAARPVRSAEQELEA